MNILLYGMPGTGKTFAAGSIANSLGRELVQIDAPQLKSHYYGDSQQIVKDCFQKMRKMSKCENPPVFLLNEADQLIHTRLDLGQSCASTENAIQNIILEELETFPGIFLATTNLLENIDEAFFRRFNYKIEFPLPDADCRRQLWKLHLPETIPGAKYIDIDFLAETYLLTGGQIKDQSLPTLAHTL
jgi:SpoVK/Ycf46/Vps4 family AAA+-type ATPase